MNKLLLFQPPVKFSETHLNALNIFLVWRRHIQIDSKIWYERDLYQGCHITNIQELVLQVLAVIQLLWVLCRRNNSQNFVRALWKHENMTHASAGNKIGFILLDSRHLQMKLSSLIVSGKIRHFLPILSVYFEMREFMG